MGGDIALNDGPKDLDAKHQDDNDDREDTKEFGKACEFLLQRGLFFAFARKHVGDLADFGLHARSDDDAFATPIDNWRRHIDFVDAVANANFFAKNHLGVLFFGHGFASKRGFIGF